MLTPARRAPSASRFILALATSVLCVPAAQAAPPTLDWMAQYDGLLSFASDQVSDMVVDAEGNTYVTGRSDEANGRQIAATVKYAPDGSLVWEDRYIGPSSGGPELGVALALGPNGDLRLQAEENVRVSLFDAEGRRKREIFSGPVGAGVHAWEIDASGLPSGIFYAVVEYGARTNTRRVTILR